MHQKDFFIVRLDEATQILASFSWMQVFQTLVYTLLCIHCRKQWCIQSAKLKHLLACTCACVHEHLGTCTDTKKVRTHTSLCCVRAPCMYISRPVLRSVVCCVQLRPKDTCMCINRLVCNGWCVCCISRRVLRTYVCALVGLYCVCSCFVQSPTCSYKEVHWKVWMSAHLNHSHVQWKRCLCFIHVC
jgi:hypothetical protein